MNLLENLDNTIKNKSFKNLYLFFGKEDFLKNLYEKKIINAVLLQQNKQMNLDIIEDKNFEVSKIIEISDTLPFMSEYRLLIIKNSNIFFENKKNETEKLLKYFKNIPNSTIIIFFEENIDKRLKIFKEFQNFGDVFEFNNFDEYQLTDWIKNFLQNYNKKMNKNEVIYFIQCVGNDLFFINSELMKLINYSSNELISKNDIDEICSKSIEMNVFNLISAMGNKNVSLAMSIYENLIYNKVSPFLILSMISRQFRILLQVKYLLKKNEHIKSISKQLNLKEFIVRDAILQSKNFTIKSLLLAINECLDIDFKIKTGILQDELAIQIIINKYSNI